MGGKEIFVYQLIQSLPADEHRVLIHRGETTSEYAHQNIRTHVLPLPRTSDPRRSYFDLTFDEIPGFEALLDSYRPDLVHFHDFSNCASLSHLRICKKKGIRTLLTYHSPGQSCLQRALIQDGQRPCSAKIDINVCTKCRYRNSGAPDLVATVMSRVWQPFPALDKIFLRANTKMFSNSWHEFHNTVDAIQVHARWVVDLFSINNIPASKVRFIEMGGHASLPKAEQQRSGPLRAVFIGRCTDIKGVHLLVDAVKLLPADAPLEVHFFGPYWDDDYGMQLKAKIGDDKRFIAPRLVPPAEVVNELRQMDFCVIPSLWPETGPFSLFDAFAAGIPVLGTRLAGIEEKTKDGIDSLLFNWNDVKDLNKKLSTLLDREFVDKLKSNIRTNRTFGEFGRDIGKLYQSVVTGQL